jgi:site-specific DNA-methyltransferase (adenine-specific)
MLPAFTQAPQPNQVYNLDWRELLSALAKHGVKVDAIITDLPYGTTACAWDTPIDLVLWWQLIKPVLKPGGVFVSTASQPFTSALVMSNPKWFRYEWIWEKDCPTGHLNAMRAPLKAHENIVVFAALQGMYNPQFVKGEPYRATSGAAGDYIRDKSTAGHLTINDGFRFPRSVQFFNKETGYHGTQKPVALYEYLIRTYTNPGDLVLDPFSGSGTTALAARNTGRRYIAGDLDAGYCEIARRRLAEPYTVPMFDATPETKTDTSATQAALFTA